MIVIFNRVGGHEIAREKCEQKAKEENPAEAEEHQETILCETCGCGDRSDVLLLCDGKTCLYYYFLTFTLVCPCVQPKNNGACKGRRERFFVDPKEVEIAKIGTNII